MFQLTLYTQLCSGCSSLHMSQLQFVTRRRHIIIHRNPIQHNVERKFHRLDIVAVSSKRFQYYLGYCTTCMVSLHLHSNQPSTFYRQLPQKLVETLIFDSICLKLKLFPFAKFCGKFSIEVFQLTNEQFRFESRERNFAPKSPFKKVVE